MTRSGACSCDRRRGRALLALALGLLILPLAACDPGDLESNGAGPSGGAEATGRPAPGFVFPSIEGGEIRLDAIEAELVLLDFWATWCPPCVVEIPELNAFYTAHRERGVELVAISVDDLSLAEVADFARENGMEYPVVLGTFELAERYGAYSFPFHVLVSGEGEILETLEPGFHDRTELADLIAKYLD